jgi:hypothetical protein
MGKVSSATATLGCGTGLIWRRREPETRWLRYWVHWGGENTRLIAYYRDSKETSHYEMLPIDTA